MSVIAIVPSDTTPAMYDDADEFQNQAALFIKKHGGETFIFDSRASMASRKREVLALLKKADADAICIAFFCHGWATSKKRRGTGVGIQAGFRTGDVADLAKAVKRFRALDAICLYCCSCAAGDRNGEKSIAAKIRDAAGVEVYAHENKGHTTRNPNYIVYDSGYNGGYHMVPRSSKHRAKWVKALKSGLWMRFAEDDFAGWAALN